MAATALHRPGLRPSATVQVCQYGAVHQLDTGAVQPTESAAAPSIAPLRPAGHQKLLVRRRLGLLTSRWKWATVGAWQSDDYARALISVPGQRRRRHNQDSPRGGICATQGQFRSTCLWRGQDITYHGTAPVSARSTTTSGVALNQLQIRRHQITLHAATRPLLDDPPSTYRSCSSGADRGLPSGGQTPRTTFPAVATLTTILRKLSAWLTQKRQQGFRLDDFAWILVRSLDEGATPPKPRHYHRWIRTYARCSGESCPLSRRRARLLPVVAYRGFSSIADCRLKRISEHF